MAQTSQEGDHPNQDPMGNMRDYNQYEAEEDWDHFQNVIAAFMYYRTYSLKRINKRDRYISSLPEVHQQRLAGYSAYLSKFRACVEVNERFLDLIVRNAENMFLNVPSPGRPQGYSSQASRDPREAHENKTQHLQVERVESVLRQFVRDWSSDGALEREQCYKPILDEIARQFPPDQCDVGAIHVLVPGAGLGRLAWEIVNLGYATQGNDVSMFMLLASNFILNHTKQKECHVLHPWINHFNNNLTCEHQLTPVRVPDIHPSDKTGDNFGMIAGEFLDVYKLPVWNCVATCFFIDCAMNVITFVENIYRILVPGGVWINIGPLLYHYSDMPETDSIEPPYDILMSIIKDVGFVLEKERTNVKTKYAQNSNSMVQHEYNSVFFVCRKPLDDTISASASYLKSGTVTGGEWCGSGRCPCPHTKPEPVKEDT